MINYQLGRRNISPEQQSYLRGVQYEREKGKREDNLKQNLPKGNIYPSVEVSKKLAQQHRVDPRTIKNDAKYARAVNAIEKAAGGNAKSSLLSRGTKITKQDAVKLGAIAFFH